MSASLGVALRFAALLEKLAPRPGDLGTARLHFSLIRNRLDRHFQVSRVLLAGSYSKGTAIRGVSDVDLFAILRWVEARWGGLTVGSDSVLRRMRDNLSERFPSTDIRRDGQAVVVRFRQGQRPVDVVPAFFSRLSSKGNPIYAIPDGAGGWMNSSPAAHTAYLRRHDERASFKLKKSVRLLKWWARCRIPSIPLRSFHAELFLAASGAAVGARTYAEILLDSLLALNSRAGASLRDPVGISGLVPAVGTEVQREALVGSLEYACEHVEAAISAEERGRLSEAVRQWRIVFNDSFPS